MFELLEGVRGGVAFSFANRINSLICANVNEASLASECADLEPSVAGESVTAVASCILLFASSSGTFLNDQVHVGLASLLPSLSLTFRLLFFVVLHVFPSSFG